MPLVKFAESGQPFADEPDIQRTTFRRHSGTALTFIWRGLAPLPGAIRQANGVRFRESLESYRYPTTGDRWPVIPVGDLLRRNRSCTERPV